MLPQAEIKGFLLQYKGSLFIDISLLRFSTVRESV